MMRRFAAAALASALALPATAQSPTPKTDGLIWHRTDPVGTWRGTSVCLVRPSSCNDEVVVYRITRMKRADSLALDGRKIVRGEEQEMGVLGCRLGPQSGQLTCTIPQGVWSFTARGDSLTGELRHSDNTRFREVRATRAP
jgi:hypothetical protein